MPWHWRSRLRSAALRHCYFSDAPLQLRAERIHAVRCVQGAGAGSALFPHILVRNMVVRVDFTGAPPPQPLPPPAASFRPWQVRFCALLRTLGQVRSVLRSHCSLHCSHTFIHGQVQASAGTLS